MSDNHLEKRATPRKPFYTHIQARYAGKGFTARSLDLSLGGMAVVCNLNLPTGMQLQIEFNVPIGRNVVPIQVKAVVVHSVFSGTEDGFKTGLKFYDIDSPTLEKLKQYLG